MATTRQITKLRFNNGDSDFNNLVKKKLNLPTILPSMKKYKQPTLKTFTQATNALDLAKKAYFEFKQAKTSDSAIEALNTIKQKITVTFSNFISPIERDGNPIKSYMLYTFVILAQADKLEDTHESKVYFDKLYTNYNDFFILIDECIKTKYPGNINSTDSKTLLNEIERLERVISRSRSLISAAIQ